MKSKLRLLAASLLASAVCGTAFAQLDNFYAEGIAGITSFKLSTGKYTNNTFTQTAPATGTTANTVTVTSSDKSDTALGLRVGYHLSDMFGVEGSYIYLGSPTVSGTAQLNTPVCVLPGPNGTLYICDYGNHAIRRIDPDGMIRGGECVDTGAPLSVPVGKVRGAMEDQSIRLQGRIESPAEFEQVVVRRRGDEVIRLGQVATVVDGFAEPTGYSLRNGQPNVNISITRSRDASTVSVANQIRKLQGKAARLSGAAAEEIGVLLEASVHMLSGSLIRGVLDRIRTQRINAEAAVEAEIHAIGRIVNALVSERVPAV